MSADRGCQNDHFLGHYELNFSNNFLTFNVDPWTTDNDHYDYLVLEENREAEKSGEIGEREQETC